MSTTMTTAVERYRPVMSEAEQTTLLGSLAGSRGYTRDAYTLDLRQFTAWCWQRQHRLFEVRRSTSSASPATWRTAARRERRWRAGCARSSASTATPKRKA